MGSHYSVAWFNTQRSWSLCQWNDSKVQGPWRTHTSFIEVLWVDLILHALAISKEVYFRCDIREVVRVYDETERKRSRSWKDQGICGDEISKDKKRNLRIFREDTIQSRFIAQLTMICEALNRLLKKEVPIVWSEQWQEAFEKIKNYLLKPPILVPLVSEKSLFHWYLKSCYCFISQSQIQQWGLCWPNI